MNSAVRVFLFLLVVGVTATAVATAVVWYMRQEVIEPYRGPR